VKATHLVIAAFALSSAAALANGNPAKQASSDSSNASSSSQQSASQQPSSPQQSSSQGDVKQAQQALKDKGFDPGAIDGQMGPKTEAALKQFQTQQKLTDSGQLDSQTETALGLQGGSSSSGSSSPSSSASKANDSNSSSNSTSSSSK
jgi:peptidoglycan hydrolase-like protein with peptidoglycan-binding domain